MVRRVKELRKYSGSVSHVEIVYESGEDSRWLMYLCNEEQTRERKYLCIKSRVYRWKLCRTSIDYHAG